MFLEGHSQHEGDLAASWNPSSLHVPIVFSELGQLILSAKRGYSYIYFGYWHHHWLGIYGMLCSCHFSN